MAKAPTKTTAEPAAYRAITPLRLDGIDYAEGDPVDLAPESAQPLIEAGLLVLAE